MEGILEPKALNWKCRRGIVERWRIFARQKKAAQKGPQLGDSLTWGEVVSKIRFGLLHSVVEQRRKST